MKPQGIVYTAIKTDWMVIEFVANTYDASYLAPGSGSTAKLKTYSSW